MHDRKEILYLTSNLRQSRKIALIADEKQPMRIFRCVSS